VTNTTNNDQKVAGSTQPAGLQVAIKLLLGLRIPTTKPTEPFILCKTLRQTKAQPVLLDENNTNVHARWT